MVRMLRTRATSAMSSRLASLLASLLTGLLALTLGTALVAPTAGAAGPGGPEQKREQRSEQRKVAERALAAAEAAAAGERTGEGAREGSGGGAARDQTLAMRDLFVAKHALRRADRAAAERLLARPTTPPDDPEDPRDIYYGEDADVQTQCAATYCLHWVEEGLHAATPAFAATAFGTIGDVAEVYVDAGFRAPLPDAGQEGDTRTDFYLGDIDSVGALGFCRSDADGPVVGSAWYAYCGFDNDYASSPWLDPASLLRITVAHEYFHAVQYAYDAEDDAWLYESTATAMEDELYDDVNDNVAFLGYGQMGDPEETGFPLSGPATPLDVFDFNAYGNWAFWRFLSEQHPDETAGIPNLARELWEALDTTQGAEATFSLEALDQVLSARGTSVPDEYVAFADASQHPGDVYEEAVEQLYPTAPNSIDAVQLSRRASTAARTAVLDHLTSATGEVLPFGGSRRLKVRVDLDGAGVARAAVTVHGLDGGTETTYVSVNKQGKGGVTVPFRTDEVASVEVTLANGSTRMRDCGAGSAYACGGSSPDDGLVAAVRFQAVG